MSFTINTSRAATNAEFANVVRLMYRKCPQEIVDIIRDTVYDSLFCDGFVYPQQHVDHSGPCNEAVNPIARPTLLCEFGRKVESKYRVRFWKENTFIIGLGEASYSTDFFQFLPPEAFDHINKIDMTFTIRDLGEWRVQSLRDSTTNPFVRKLLEEPIERPKKRSSKRTIKAPPADSTADNTKKHDQAAANESSEEEEESSEDPSAEEETAAATDDDTQDSSSSQEGIPITPAQPSTAPLGEAEEEATPRHHHDLHQELTLDLETAWTEKFSTISNLPLTALTLDFSECYGPAGDWLGTDLARSFPALEKGWPAVFMIHAPDRGKKEEIEGAMLKRYLDSIPDPDNIDS